MLNVDGSNSPAVRRLSAKRTPSGTVSFTQWLHQTLGLGQGRLRARAQGNTLHLLCESWPCPEAEQLIPRIQQVLTTVPLSRFLGEGAAPIHRLVLYGRTIGETKPAWTHLLYLDGRATSAQYEPAVAASTPLAESHPVSEPLHASEAARSLVSPLQLAQQGQPAAIARYLNDSLSHLNVTVRAKLAQPQEAVDPPQSARLLVVCESVYSPDPVLIAEPIAQRLRELDLQGFQDAVVFGQVSGEPRPEWVLRVDLTPITETLQAWARWGDVQAMTCLLNRALASEQLQVSALLKSSTLHLSCTAVPHGVPDQLTTVALVSPLLQALAPQGILAASIYGLPEGAIAEASGSEAVNPTWVHWLDLPATARPELVTPTLELAQQGNLEALEFLLTRLVNPDLATTLATGGIRVQVRQKGDLLHIMTDAPNCPRQDQVGTAIARFLKPLPIDTVTGVRVYGRRAGQKQPLWNYGVDFVTRSRLVPEAVPEFAASDAYVNELLSPPGALVRWADVQEEGWSGSIQRVWVQALQQVQRGLVRSQLFVPLDAAALAAPPSDLAPSAPVPPTQAPKVALIWGTVGLLLLLQFDWLAGQWLRPPSLTPQAAAPAPTASPTATATESLKLPKLSLQKTKNKNWSSFNSSGFTGAGTTIVSAPDATDAAAPPAALPASPPKPPVALSPAQIEFATFNSRQLDLQLTIYRQYLEQYGPPDVLIVGSSRALRGVDPVALQTALAEQGYAGVRVFNFGVNGATAQVVDLVIRQLLPATKSPKLILFADGARAFNSGRVDITYNGVVASKGYRSLVAGQPPIPGTTVAQISPATAKPQPAPAPATGTETASTLLGGYQQVEQSLGNWLGTLSQAYPQRDRLKAKMQASLSALLPSMVSGAIASETLLNSSSPAASAATSPTLATNGQNLIDADGFLPLSQQFNPVTYYQKYARVAGAYDSDYESFHLDGLQTTALIELAQFTQRQRIPLVFVNLPLTEDYLDSARQRYEDDFQQHMLELAPDYGFTYRDLSQIFLRQPKYFSDPSHLNRYGAYEVSRRLAQDVMIPWQETR